MDPTVYLKTDKDGNLNSVFKVKLPWSITEIGSLFYETDLSKDFIETSDK
jgi:hypothetical protein